MFKIFVLFLLLFCFVGCFLSFRPKNNHPNTKILKSFSTQNLDADQSVPICTDADKIIALAKAQLGTRYCYGGMQEGGFDCSGFVAFVYQKAIGKKLPRTAKAQSKYVEIYPLDRLQKGDLLFFDTSLRGVINHSGIYLGGGKFIHASSGKAYSVTISDLTKGFYKTRFRWGGKIDQ